ncbi:FAD dependent oxidoreductase [Thozetella sp. PMI_491]|nr:FAD dependent oxidoreductase [Thozetella sp. PMI_491]
MTDKTGRHIVVIGLYSLWRQEIGFLRRWLIVFGSSPGGGVIGCCTAYYLTKHHNFDANTDTITLLESGRIAGGASGKAGGLLAQWAYPASLVPLSFDLHASLAEEHDGAAAWGYRLIRCGKVTARDPRCQQPPAPPQWGESMVSWATRQLSPWVLLGKRREVEKDPGSMVVSEEEARLPKDLDWFRQQDVEKYEDIAPASATAQVQPALFTSAMARLAEEGGAKILIDSPVEGLEYALANNDSGGEKKKVRAVRYVDKATAQAATIPADIVVLAAGPWTPTLFPHVPMSSLRAHSVTIRPSRPLSGYCLFTEITVPARKEGVGEEGEALATRVVCPEVYSRPNNEVYIAGEGDTRVSLPANTDEVEVDRESCQLIVDVVRGISDELQHGLVTSRRACYLPIVDTPSGAPLIGRTWIEGLIIATGHGCWGIHNAPATGKLVSELIFDGHAQSADISALDPELAL